MTVEEFADGLSTDIYTVLVLDVIKEGGFVSITLTAFESYKNLLLDLYLSY